MIPTFADPMSHSHNTDFYPANKETKLLLTLLTACKQVSKCIDSLDEADPINDKYGLVRLTTSLLIMIDKTIKLRQTIGQANRSHWSAVDRDLLRKETKKLNRFNRGKLRILRNKLSAHIDEDVFTSIEPAMINISLLLLPLRSVLCVAILLLNHEEIYRWSKTNDDGTIEIAGTGPIPVSMKCCVVDDHITELKGLALLDEDPRYYAKRIIDSCIEAYNSLATLAQHQEIILIER